MYRILPYTYKKAKELNVNVFPSENPKYKIDVYKDNKYICSIGSSGYKDFPTFLKENGLKYALRRRIFYKKRHERDRHTVGTRGWFADNLLW
jgi:hypothetical protein